jgi:hypothetical protein
MFYSQIETTCQLTWLLAKLSDRRTQIADLLRRLTGFGPAGALKNKIFGKFLLILDEVALAKRHENCLLEQIEAIEQRHRFMRKNRQLKRAVKRLNASNGDEFPESASQTPAFLPILLMWYVFAPLKINHKKQSLTVA